MAMLPSVAMTVQPLPVEWGQLLVDWRQRELAWFPEFGEQKSALLQRGVSPLLVERVGRPAYPAASSRPLPAPESAPYRQGNSPSHPFCDWRCSAAACNEGIGTGSAYEILIQEQSPRTRSLTSSPAHP